MKTVNLVSNWDSPRCGIQGFGEDLAAALEYAGFQVDRRGWGAPLLDHRTIYNWHHQTAPPIDPPEGPCTVIAHEVPLYPDVVWPDWFRRPGVQVLVGEPYQHYEVFRYPALDYVSPYRPQGETVILGTTGLRGDGVELLRRACQHAGWVFSCSPEKYFASRQEEIDRLAGCHVVALWYWATGRAQSLALPVALAARRPLLLSQSSMLARTTHPRVPWTEQLDEIIAAAFQAPVPIARLWTWADAVCLLRQEWR